VLATKQYNGDIHQFQTNQFNWLVSSLYRIVMQGCWCCLELSWLLKHAKLPCQRSTTQSSLVGSRTITSVNLMKKKFKSYTLRCIYTLHSLY